MSTPLASLRKPQRPYFSSGPTVKPVGWSPQAVAQRFPLGRTHRAPPCQALLDEARARTHALLNLPDDYVLMLTPGSATGALEMALWNLLGPLEADVLAADPFGHNWAQDGRSLLGDRAHVHTASDFSVPSLGALNPKRDGLMVVNATPTGTWQLPPARAADDPGLSMVDITSAAFLHDFDWSTIDVAGFSWQKALGGEAQHGMLILSPKAVARLEAGPYRPLPKMMTMRPEYLRGLAVNTPSFLAVADWLWLLDWAEGLGGLHALMARTRTNAQHVSEAIESSKHWQFAVEPGHRSNISMTLTLKDGGDRETYQALAKRLADAGAGFDLMGHRKAAPCLRIWCGPTVEAEDIQALMPWFDWAVENT